MSACLYTYNDKLTTVGSFSEIEEQVRNLQAKRQALASGIATNDDDEDRIGLGATGHYDQDIYGTSAISRDSRFVGYDTSIAVTDEPDVSSVTTAYHAC